MKTLSTGHPSTLASYRLLTVAVFGPDSAATKWLDEKIAASPEGADAEVIADEAQTLLLLSQLHFGAAAC